MTSHFDNLQDIYRLSRNSEELRELSHQLADLCIEQADEKEEDWSYEDWKKTTPAAKRKEIDELNLKYRYLEDCHSHLDHGDYHLEVFNTETIYLLCALKKLLLEGRITKSVHRYDEIRGEFEKIEKLLEPLTTETRIDIKLKEDIKKEVQTAW